LDKARQLETKEMHLNEARNSVSAEQKSNAALKVVSLTSNTPKPTFSPSLQ
jgi:hypothetical protein